MTQKYMAKHAPDESDDAEHEWYVEYEDGGNLVSLNGLREAEAAIIVYALTVVENGHTLCSSSLYDPLDALSESGDINCSRYNGPALS